MNIGNIVSVNPNPYLGFSVVNLKADPDRPFVAYGQQLIPVTLSDRLTVLEVRRDVWDTAAGRNGTLVKLLTPTGRAGWCFTDALIPA